MKEFDEYLSDYLADGKISSLAPKIKASETFKAITQAAASIQEKQSGQEKNFRELRLVFSSHYRAFDALFGVYAGECLTVQTLARNDVVNATLFQNDEIAGGVLLLMEQVNGKKSLVIIGIDPSVKVVEGIDSKKAVEICDWMVGEVYNYARANGFKLYITKSVGGITNRHVSMDKYFGHKKYQLATRVGTYSPPSARNLLPPKNLEAEKEDRKWQKLANRRLISSLYGIEKKAFTDNPAIMFDKATFNEMFSGATVLATLKKGRRYAGFAVANPMIESTEQEDAEEMLEQIKPSMPEEVFSKLQKSTRQGKAYYLDDIAILEPNMNTRGMMKDFFAQLEKKGADTFFFHARIKDGQQENFSRVMEMNGFRNVYQHIEKEWWGGEDFMLMAYVKETPAK